MQKLADCKRTFCSDVCMLSQVGGNLLSGDKIKRNDLNQGSANFFALPPRFRLALICGPALNKLNVWRMQIY